MAGNWRLTSDIWRNIGEECADLNVISSLLMSNTFFYNIMQPTLDYKKLCINNQLCRMPGESWYQAFNQFHHLHGINACGRFVYCKDSERFALVFETFIIVTTLDVTTRYFKYIPINSRALMVQLLNQGKTLLVRKMNSWATLFIDIDSNTIKHSVEAGSSMVRKGCCVLDYATNAIHSPYFPYKWMVDIRMEMFGEYRPQSCRNTRNTQFIWIHGEDEQLYLVDVKSKRTYSIPHDIKCIVDYLPSINCVFLQNDDLHFTRLYNLDTGVIVFEEQSKNGKSGWEIINDYIIHDTYTGRIAYFDEMISQFVIHPDTLGDIIYGSKGPVNVYKRVPEYQNFLFVRQKSEPKATSRILMVVVDKGSLKYRRFTQENGVYHMFEKLYEDIRIAIKTLDGERDVIIQDVFESWYGEMEKKYSK